MNARLLRPMGHALSLILLAACGRPPPEGELRLRAEAAEKLGVSAPVLPEIHSSAVPRPTRTLAEQMRGLMGGGERAVRYFSADSRTIAVLIPTRSFEGEDPHVVVASHGEGEAAAYPALRTNEAVDRYCPAEGVLGPQAAARDSADGCRYFDPHPLPEPVPPPE